MGDLIHGGLWLTLGLQLGQSRTCVLFNLRSFGQLGLFIWNPSSWNHCEAYYQLEFIVLAAYCGDWAFIQISILQLAQHLDTVCWTEAHKIKNINSLEMSNVFEGRQ